MVVQVLAQIFWRIIFYLMFNVDDEKKVRCEMKMISPIFQFVLSCSAHAQCCQPRVCTCLHCAVVTAPSLDSQCPHPPMFRSKPTWPP